MESKTATETDPTMRIAGLLIISGASLGILTVFGMDYNSFNGDDIPVMTAVASASIIIGFGVSQFSNTLRAVLTRFKWVVVAVAIATLFAVPEWTSMATQIGIAVGVASGAVVVGFLFTLTEL